MGGGRVDREEAGRARAIAGDPPRPTARPEALEGRPDALGRAGMLDIGSIKGTDPG